MSNEQLTEIGSLHRPITTCQ